MRYRQNTQSESIRENFRKQIRRKQIQQFFATKRKLATDSIQQINKNIPHKNLSQLFQRIKSLTNLDQNLSNLGNYLYQTDCLIKTQQQIGKKNTQDLCMRIASTIFNTIMPTIYQHTQQNQSNRKKCLTIISNIMADPSSPHNQLVPIIIEGINSNYSSISQSNSQQIIQIGWIIANTLCHKLDLSIQSQLQKPIQQILTLTQQLILLPNLQMINILYSSLKNFFNYIDNYYKSSSHSQIQHATSNKKQVQHYKIHRLILLQNTVAYNLSIQFGTTLISILSFIQNNLIYAHNCSQKLCTDICVKSFKILSCTSSDKIMCNTFKLLGQLISDREIIVIIVKDYFHILQNCLMYHSFNIKIYTLRLLIYLCTQEEITIFMVQNKQLQIILSQLVKGIRDTQVLHQIMILTQVIIQKTNMKYGIETLGNIQEYLCHKTGPVGQFATSLVAKYQNQMRRNKMI